MAIGIVSDKDFQDELNRTSSIKPPNDKPKVITPELVEERDSLIQDIKRRGRSSGDVNVPDSLRQIIGETALLEGRPDALRLAEMFGISVSSVSAYSKGATSTATYDQPKSSIINHINKARVKALKKAQRTMNSALDGIDETKINDSSARDLSAIAKDMSAIIRNLEPPASPINESNNPQDKQPQFVVFAPQFRSEQSFESITINE